MALDVRERRANALSVGRPWIRTKEPSAAKDQAWRGSSANSYGGNRLSPVIITDSLGKAAAGPQNTERGLASFTPERGFVAGAFGRGLKVGEFE